MVEMEAKPKQTAILQNTQDATAEYLLAESICTVKC
jgi:hypothetical protein